MGECTQRHRGCLCTTPVPVCVCVRVFLFDIVSAPPSSTKQWSGGATHIPFDNIERGLHRFHRCCRIGPAHWELPPHDVYECVCMSVYECVYLSVVFVHAITRSKNQRACVCFADRIVCVKSGGSPYGGTGRVLAGRAGGRGGAGARRYTDVVACTPAFSLTQS